MSTVVVPVPRPAIDVEQMIDRQAEEMEAFFQSTAGVMRPRWPLKEYLKRVIDAHIDLIELFGGWRWHSQSFAEMPLSADQVTKLITEEKTRWLRGATLYENDRKRAPEKQKAIPLTQMFSPADLIWCGKFGCHFPEPVPSHDLWRAGRYTAPDGAKEALEQYASQLSVKIRTGQAPTRAVLAEVRKIFKEHPEYVRMWESICEKIGIAWQASKGNPITFSCAPVDFIRMGHFGEGGSCYATGGGQEHSKYNISMIHNSVMYLFYSRDDGHQNPMTLRPQKVIGRAWGLIDVDNQGAAATNIYLLYFKQVQPSMEAAFEQLFGWRVTGGLPQGQSFTPFTRYAYTNNDTNLFAAKANLDAVQRGIARQVTLPESEQHHRVVCVGCGTAYGHASMLFKCGCGNLVCETCARVTACCGAKYCTRCKPVMTNCSGCDKATCDRCTSNQGVPSICTDTKKQYCTECAGKALTACGYCRKLTSTPSKCAIKGDVACQVCAKEKHRICDRCHETVSLEYVTRCSGCKERRCDRCLKDGESTEPKALCAACQQNGVPAPKAFEPNPELLKQFEESLKALPPEMRKQYLAHMSEFTWDLDEILLDELDDDDVEENEEDEDE